ncbi:hypothetical protein BGZ58_007100 [Dissophora ornata]|nr:hypothetical protein BGZ58_007100 [Dissophora ornata]
MGTTPAANVTEDGNSATNQTNTTEPSVPTTPREHTSPSHKPSSPILKTLRRIPSALNSVSSNATTSWTIGQQKSGNRRNAVPPTTAVPSPDDSAATDAFSGRSKFLRAFGRFKNRHLSRRKSNAAGTGAPSVTSNNSDNMSTSASITSSFVLPPMHFDNDLSFSSADQGSSANAPHSDSTSASMRSYVGPAKHTENTEQFRLQDIDMEDSEARRSYAHDDGSGSSSLRVKFKNRVHNTLAHIKSSSNLREKARSQQRPTSAPISFASTSNSTNSTPIPSPTESIQVQQLQSSFTSTTSDPQQSTAMIRLSKPFWTLPRVRPESSSSKLLPWTSSSRRSSLAEKTPRGKTHIPDLDAAMFSPEIRTIHDVQQPSPAKDVAKEDAVDEFDSDDSIDFIMPGDYNDYTQFAELPLKKRKKLEAAAAAAAAAATTQDPSGRRSRTMKRFLLPQKSNAEKEQGKATENDQIQGTQNNPVAEVSAPTETVIPERSSKKRPKDQDSIDQKPSEWRKAIMKSLHIGRATKKVKASSTPTQSLSGSPVDEMAPSIVFTGPRDPLQSSHRDSGVYPGDQGFRLKRSESTSSTRSRSLGTSTHAGLMATTVTGPKAPGTGRETLEMAMRRRRRSSAVRTNLLDPNASFMLPGGPRYFDDDAASTHVTHTFTSFTLELADLHHAQAVVNDSVTPGLFNFKRQPRMTMSSVHQMDTDQEFKGFESDGDAMSGYTGDADISMDEIFVRSKTSAATRDGREKGKRRDSSSSELTVRRKMSIGDIDSDTLSELPVSSMRTRDLNRSSSGGRSSYNKQLENNGRESPRSPRRSAASGTPTLNRKPSRHLPNGSPIVTGPTPGTVASSPPRNSHLSNILQQSRSTVPTLNTKLPVSQAKNGQETFHHQRQSSSSHHQQASSDTLLPHHLKNFSTASTLSASSGYSAQTLNGSVPLTFQPKEFDASQDFSPSTLVDLKSMDFESLLRTAEREQQKSQEEQQQQQQQRTLKKKKSFQFQNSKPLKIYHGGVGAASNGDRFNNVENYENVFLKSSSSHSPLNTKSALSALVASAPNLDELRTRGSDASFYSIHSNQISAASNGVNHNRSHSSLGGRYNGGLQVQTNRMERPPSAHGHYPRVPVSKSAITFEMAESAAMAHHARIRNNPRSQRVMKKKTSVITLSGNVQGRREDDGMIRVSVAPTIDPRQWRAS